MSLPPEHLDATHDLVYLAKHPDYEFALTRSPPSCPDPSPRSPLVQLWFRSQPQQPGIVLTLAALEHFYDALSRLLDYVKQERAGWTTIPSSGASTESAMAPISEALDHSTDRHQLEAHHSVVRLNHQASTAQLCRLSGVVLAGLIALLSWALYSLSTGGGEFGQPQATAAQESLLHSPATAIPDGPPPQGEGGVHQLLPDGRVGRIHGVVEAGEPRGRMGVRRSSPPVSSSRGVAQADPAPHIYLHIQFPAQRTTAQRLAARLQQKGYIVPKAAILMAKGPSRTEVRYFRTTEAEEAAAIAVLLHEAYRPPATTRYIRGHEGASHSRLEHYEIWLGREPR